MKKSALLSLSAAAVLAWGAVFPATAQTVDEKAAQSLQKKNDCTKCHALDKTKKGPSLKKIAEKYKGKPDGFDKVIKAMTSEHKVKLEDGSEDDHKVIKASKEEAANLAHYILSR